MREGRGRREEGERRGYVRGDDVEEGWGVRSRLGRAAPVAVDRLAALRRKRGVTTIVAGQDRRKDGPQLDAGLAC